MGRRIGKKTTEIFNALKQSPKPMSLREIADLFPEVETKIQNFVARKSIKSVGRNELGHKLYVLADRGHLLLKESKYNPLPVPDPIPSSNLVDPEKVVEGIFSKIEEMMTKNKELKTEIKTLKEENSSLKEENQQLRTLAGKAQSKGIVVPTYALPR